LNCYNNQITKLPGIFPVTLVRLSCSGNSYLHIPKKYAKPFGLIETPDYNKKADYIQQIWRRNKYKLTMIKMIQNNDNMLSNSFKNYGDLNIINLIIQFIY